MNLFIARTQLRRALIASLLALSAVSLSANWSLGFKAGLAPITGGDVHRGLSFDGSVLLGLPAGSLPVDVDAKSFGDVYSKFEDIAFEASYAAGENLAYMLGVSWLSSEDGNLRVGTVAGGCRSTAASVHMRISRSTPVCAITFASPSAGIPT
jgi:hypothetical protein